MTNSVKKILSFLLAVAIFFLCVVHVPTAGAYDPPGTFSYTSNTTVPQTGVLIKTGAGVFGGAVAWNASGGTAYLMCFDRTTQPATGTAPQWGSASCASNTFCAMVAVPAGGYRNATGIYCAWSSTGPTYTQAVGSSTGYISVLNR